MIITVIYLFALLSTPTDRIVCDIWTRIITRDAMVAACGSDELPSAYRVDVYSLNMQMLCTRPAADLMNIVNACDLHAPLDEYILRVVKPVGASLICMVESRNKDLPTSAEIADQCPQAKPGAYTVKYSGEKKQVPAFSCPKRNLQNGNGLYEQVTSVYDLHTETDLTWLAGRLIWFGHSKTYCTGSGLTRSLAADECGMMYARADVIGWQNQFDAEIYKSALAYNVPAKLLKQIMLTESQMWPFYDAPTGETGVMQITDNGLDTLYRFDPALDVDYLKRNDTGKFYERSVTRDALTCVNCNMEEAIAHIKTSMDIYARTLAAFHCRAVTINPALVGQIAWRQAVVDYNGSAEYLAKIERQ